MGFRAVGKSTITIQFVENHFVDAYNPTIENAFHKIIQYKGVDFNCEILDTAGQDEFSQFQKHHAVGIHGYILLYSVTSQKSWNVVKGLNEKILNAIGADKAPRVLVGNKSDLHMERKISKEEGQALANEWGCAFVECSGKHNENIEQVFTTMLAEIEKENKEEDPTQKKTCVFM